MQKGKDCQPCIKEQRLNEAKDGDMIAVPDKCNGCTKNYPDNLV